MRKVLIPLLCLLFSFSIIAKYRLSIYDDYELGTELISMTTVKVDANMGDIYLAGLQDSWVKAVKIQKELGFIKDWKIYGSDLPQSGNFNMILMVMFNSAADAEPNKKKYQAFMKTWGGENEKESHKISATYPDVRTLTGEYRFREIMMK
jgi:ABC-type branched-subunit amino acid transport system substrate-binding protein